jgi:hypothetical protein
METALCLNPEIMDGAFVLDLKYKYHGDGAFVLDLKYKHHGDGAFA